LADRIKGKRDEGILMSSRVFVSSSATEHLLGGMHRTFLPRC
jgi:hypothetical protein